MASGAFADPADDVERVGAMFAALTAVLSGALIWLRRRAEAQEELG